MTIRENVPSKCFDCHNSREVPRSGSVVCNIYNSTRANCDQFKARTEAPEYYILKMYELGVKITPKR